jgi:pyruvate,water dikinase
MTFPTLDRLSYQDRPQVGGKAANLGELCSLGLPVPRGFVIPTRFSNSFLRGRSARSRSQQSAESLDSLLETPVPPRLAREILRSYNQLGARATSVRSSANVEDAADVSFAGVFESFLNVEKHELLYAVKRCWLSSVAPRVMEYLARHSTLAASVDMAVIVQELVEPDVSGVCFTSHPISDDADILFIEVVCGFGELLVSGRVTPDSYTYHFPSRQITSAVIGNQDLARRLVAGTLCDVPVPQALRQSQKMSDALIHNLATTSHTIATHYGRPQDIEFAVRGNTLMLLQSRPITTNRRQ